MFCEIDLKDVCLQIPEDKLSSVFDNDCHSLWFIETQLLFGLSGSLNIIQEEMKSAVSELKGIEVCQDDFSFYGPHTILFDQRLTTVLRHLLKIKYA